MIIRSPHQQAFNDLLAGVTSEEGKREVILRAVERGLNRPWERRITNKLDHVWIAVEHYNDIYRFADGARLISEYFCDAIGVCEARKAFGVAAHIAEGKGRLKDAKRLYEKQVDRFEELRMFGLAAELSQKLGYADRARVDYEKAGNLEWVSELSRRSGDKETAKAMADLSSLLK